MKDKYTDQVEFVKALAEHLPDEKPTVWGSEPGRMIKHQLLADIKRLRRELLELARVVGRL